MTLPYMGENTKMPDIRFRFSGKPFAKLTTAIRQLMAKASKSPSSQQRSEVSKISWQFFFRKPIA